MKILREGDRGYALAPERGRVEIVYEYRTVELELLTLDYRLGSSGIHRHGPPLQGGRSKASKPTATDASTARWPGATTSSVVRACKVVPIQRVDTQSRGVRLDAQKAIAPHHEVLSRCFQHHSFEEPRFVAESVKIHMHLIQLLAAW